MLVLCTHYGLVEPFWGDAGGRVGVPMFFVCSGYLITRSTAKENLFQPSIKRFYIKRFSRIVPLLLLTIAIAFHLNSTLIMGKQLTSTFYVDNLAWLMPFAGAVMVPLWAVLQFPVGVQGLFWGLLWTLGAEFQFYLAYPWLLRWSKTRKRLVAVMVAIASFGFLSNLLIFAFNIPPAWTHQNPYSAFGCIEIGVLLWLLAP